MTGGGGKAYRLFCLAVMVGAVLAITLPSIAPDAWQMGAAMLTFLLALMGFIRLRKAGGRVFGSVLLGLALFALSFAVPTAGGLSGGMAGAGAVVLVNAWIAKANTKGQI